MRRTVGWRHLVVWSTCVLAVLTFGERVAAQSADDGLEEASVNSFEFDPARGVVRVTIDIDLRNVTTDRIEGDAVRRTYFDGYAVAVPLGAENIVASDNGTVLDGTLLSDPDFPAFSTYRFPLGTPLFSGESASLRVTYDHLGAPPRDPVPWRVNEAYAGFVAFGFGDEGRVTLRISRPFGYEFDAFTDLTGFDAGEPDDDVSPYDTGSPSEQPSEDWQRVYDAIVEVGRSATASDAFRTCVVDADGAGLVVLRDRAAATWSDAARPGRCRWASATDWNGGSSTTSPRR